MEYLIIASVCFIFGVGCGYELRYQRYKKLYLTHQQVMKHYLELCGHGDVSDSSCQESEAPKPAQEQYEAFRKIKAQSSFRDREPDITLYKLEGSVPLDEEDRHPACTCEAHGLEFHSERCPRALIDNPEIQKACDEYEYQDAIQRSIKESKP